MSRPVGRCCVVCASAVVRVHGRLVRRSCMVMTAPRHAACQRGRFSTSTGSRRANNGGVARSIWSGPARSGGLICRSAPIPGASSSVVGDKVCRRQLCKYPTPRTDSRKLRAVCARPADREGLPPRRGFEEDGRVGRGNQAVRPGNQRAISRSADSGESEPCTRLFWVLSAKSPRIVPGTAFSLSLIHI